MGGVSLGIIEVAIGPGQRLGSFRVEVVRSAAGEAAAEVILDADGLLAERLRFQQILLASSVPARQILSTAETSVRDVGRTLFTALLGTGEVTGRYRASAALADDRGEELRIVLRIDVPELAGLPWEAMYDSATGGYVCRHHEVVRHVPVAAVPPPLQVRMPLRVLGVISAPRGLPPLDVDREREQLERALVSMAGLGLAEVSWAPPTWAGLHEMLLAEPWHVLHFIGHGDFDPDRDEGVLALTDEHGRADLVEASRFADLLRQARPMPRLVVLNSCSGATTGPGDLFSGMAAALARGGVAAVAAMQFSISDPAAIAFARGFYTALAHGRAVDESVSAGRISILGTSGRTLEWITPVLYLRGTQTQLFAISSTPVPSPPPKATSSPANSLKTAPPTPVPSRLIRVLQGHKDFVQDVAFSPDSTLLATGSSDGTVRIWRSANGALIRSLKGPRVRPVTDDSYDDAWDHYVWQVAFSPDGTLLAAACADNKPLRIWDISTGSLVSTPKGHGRGASGVAFSPDGTLLASAGDDATARISDIATDTPIHVLTGHNRSLSGVAFSPDGTLLATTSWDHTARIWDTATGGTIHILSTHTGAVHYAAFSPNGALLATASADKTAMIWDTATGTPTQILTGHIDIVVDVAFSPDGTLLATVSNDKTARIWNVGTGSLIRTLTGHPQAVHGVAFSPDGTMLATASGDNTARLWA